MFAEDAIEKPRGVLELKFRSSSRSLELFLWHLAVTVWPFDRFEKCQLSPQKDVELRL